MNIDESVVELLDSPVPAPSIKRKRDEGDDDVHEAVYRPVPKHPLLDSITNRIQQNLDDNEQKDALLQSKREAEKVHSQYLKQNVADPAELARASYAAGHWAMRNGIKESNLRRASKIKRKQTAHVSTTLNSSSPRPETIPAKRLTVNSGTSQSPDYLSRLLNRNSLVSSSRNTDSDYTEQDNGEDDLLPIFLSNYGRKHLCPVLCCEAEFNSEGALGQHMNLFQHSPCNPCRYTQDLKLLPDPSCYMCPDCDQEFSARDICSEHMKRENHLVFYMPLGITAYLCPQCLHLFENLEICWRHMEQLNHHQISYPFTDDTETDFSLPIPVAEEFVRDYIGKCKKVPFQLQCLNCDMDIAGPAYLRDHFNETNDQHTVSAFTNKDLNDIFRTYIRTYSCDTCHRLFTEQTEPNAKHSCAKGIVGIIKVDQVRTYAAFIKRCALTLITSLEFSNQYRPGRRRHHEFLENRDEPKQCNISDSVGEEVRAKQYKLLNNVDDIKADLEAEDAVTIQEIKCVKSKSKAKETCTGTNGKKTKSDTSVKCSNMNKADSSMDKTKKLTKRHTDESIPENTYKSLMPFERGKRQYEKLERHLKETKQRYAWHMAEVEKWKNRSGLAAERKVDTQDLKMSASRLERLIITIEKQLKDHMASGTISSESGISEQAQTSGTISSESGISEQAQTSGTISSESGIAEQAQTSGTTSSESGIAEQAQSAVQESKTYGEPRGLKQVNNLYPLVEETEYLQISDSEDEIITISDTDEDEEEKNGTGDENEHGVEDENEDGVADENDSVGKEKTNRNIQGMKEELDEKENDRNCVKSPVWEGVSKNQQEKKEWKQNKQRAAIGKKRKKGKGKKRTATERRKLMYKRLEKNLKGVQSRYDRLSTTLKRNKHCAERTPELNTELLVMEICADKQERLILKLKRCLKENMTVINTGKCSTRTFRGRIMSNRLVEIPSVPAVLLQNQDDSLVSTEHLKNMKNIVFLDLDNCANFFMSLAHCLPDHTFVWGFYGGDTVLSQRVLNSTFDEMQRRGLVYVDKPCGKTKDAADFALVLTVGKMEERLPPSVAFTIISADQGFHEVVRQMKRSSRRAQIVNPHKIKTFSRLL